MRKYYKMYVKSALEAATLPESGALMTHKGVTKLVEVGRIMSIYFTPKISYILLKVGSSDVSEACLQVERWLVPWSRYTDEALKELSVRLKPGMLVAIQGERRTVYNKYHEGNSWVDQFTQISRLERVTILEPTGGLREKVKAQIKIYDRMAKNYEYI